MQQLPDSMLKHLAKLPEARRVEYLKAMAETLVNTFNKFDNHVIIVWPRPEWGVNVMSSPCSHCASLLLEAASEEMAKHGQDCDHGCPEPFIQRRGVQ